MRRPVDNEFGDNAQPSEPVDPVRDINARIPIIPHEDVAPGVDCCGCLYVRAVGDQAEIVCNECGALIRTVAVGEVERVMSELGQTDTICSARCPHCGELNTFQGFSTIDAFVCSHCGEGVAVNLPIQ